MEKLNSQTEKEKKLMASRKVEIENLMLKKEISDARNVIKLK